MNEGEAARTAFAIAQVTHLISSFDGRLRRLEAQVESMAQAHNGLATELRNAIEALKQQKQ